MKIDADVELKVHIHEIQVYHCKAWLLHYIQIKTKQYETSVQLKVLHFYQILAIAMSSFSLVFSFFSIPFLLVQERCKFLFIYKE